MCPKLLVELVTSTSPENPAVIGCEPEIIIFVLAPPLLLPPSPRRSSSELDPSTDTIGTILD